MIVILVIFTRVGEKNTAEVIEGDLACKSLPVGGDKRICFHHSPVLGYSFLLPHHAHPTSIVIVIIVITSLLSSRTHDHHIAHHHILVILKCIIAVIIIINNNNNTSDLPSECSEFALEQMTSGTSGPSLWACSSTCACS